MNYRRFTYVFMGLIAGFANVALAQQQGTDVLIEGPVESITVAEIEDMLFTLRPGERKVMAGDPARFRKMIDFTYLSQVAAMDAKRNGLDKDPETKILIERSIRDILAEAQIQHEIAQAMKAMDLDTAAKEYYAAYKDEYIVRKKLDASHILLSVEEGNTQEALAKIKGFLADIRSGKSSFEDIAKAHSADKGSAEKGGKLNTFGQGELVPPFEEAVFAMDKTGAISEPVRTEFGFHIIRLDAIHPEHFKPFDSVKGDIVKKLERRTKKRIRENYFVTVRDDPSVQVDQKRIDDMFSSLAEEK